MQKSQSTPLISLTQLSGRYGTSRDKKHDRLNKAGLTFTCDICGNYFGKRKESKIKNICVNCENK